MLCLSGFELYSCWVPLNNVIKNMKCLIVFEFRAKLFGQELLDFGQPNLIILVLVRRTSKWENFSITLYMYEYILCELLISSFFCNF